MPLNLLKQMTTNPHRRVAQGSVAVGLYPTGREFKSHPAYQFNDCEIINLTPWKDRELMRR